MPQVPASPCGKRSIMSRAVTFILNLIYIFLVSLVFFFLLLILFALLLFGLCFWAGFNNNRNNNNNNESRSCSSNSMAIVAIIVVVTVVVVVVAQPLATCNLQLASVSCNSLPFVATTFSEQCAFLLAEKN